MFSRLEFILSETLTSLRRHPGMAFAAVLCVAAALFVSGLAGLTYLNADYAVETALNRVRFNVYFQRETGREEAHAAYQRLLAMPEVKEAEFIPREAPWEKLKQEDPSLVRNLSRNPYPDSVIAKARDVTDISTIKGKLSRWPEVEAVRHSEDVSTILTNARDAVSKYGVLIGFVLAVLSLVIIHHTIELTLYARRKEIQIMSLVGATPTAVASPFLLEGVAYGLIGGGIALGFLIPLYRAAINSLKTNFDIHLLAYSPELMHGIWAILAGGLALGLIGSLVSITKYLCRPRSRVTNA